MFLVLLVSSCGSTLRLPEEQFGHPEPHLDASSSDLGQKLTAFVSDRTLGRSGYSCRDCHGFSDDVASTWRPAPRLAVRSFSDSVEPGFEWALNRCAERHMMRPSWSEKTITILRANLKRISTAVRASKTLSGAEIYERACQHCHQSDLAGTLLGRPLLRARLQRFVRSPSRAGTTPLMPAFGFDELSEEHYRVLATYLLEGQFAE